MKRKPNVDADLLAIADTWRGAFNVGTTEKRKACGHRKAIARVSRTLERWLSRQDYDDYNDTIAVKRSVLVRLLADLRSAR